MTAASTRSSTVYYGRAIPGEPARRVRGVDRDRPVHEVRDVYVHVVRERDDGMVVSGAKLLVTGPEDQVRGPDPPVR